MAKDKVILEVGLDPSSAKKGFKKVEKQAKKTADKAEGFLTAGFGKAAGAVAGLAAGLAAAFGAREAIAAARAQEDAVNKFNTALKLSGKFTQEASVDFQNFASELQRTTKIGDELTLETAALIQGLGQLEGEALKDATLAAADLSAALGIDLKAAALLVGKAAAGEVSSFSRYGLVIKKGADNSETFARALEGINSKFGGSAAAQVKTFSGAIEQFGNAFGDVLEGFGDFIVKVPVFGGVIQRISGILLDTSDNLKSFTDNAVGIDKLNEQVIAFGQGVIAWVVFPIEQIGKVGTAAFDILLAGFQTILGGLARVGEAILKTFSFIGGSGGELTQGAQDFFDTFKEQAIASANDAQDAIGNIGRVTNEDLSVSANAALESFRTVNQGLKLELESLEGPAAKASADLAAVGKAGKIAGLDIGKGVASGFVQAAKAAVNGGNALKGFASGFLGFIANWATQTGSTLIAIGLGIESLKASIIGLTGGPALAAGIALVFLGALLSKLAGGGAASAPNASTGGGVASASGGQESAPVAAEAAEAEQKTTQVAINVEGTVLDPIAVGLQISEILSDTFEATGTKVVTV